MTYGRLGTAPCGHRGEAIVGHYYACLEGCDSKHGARPPVAPFVRGGLPSHVGKSCRCLSCIGYIFAAPPATHTTCVCVSCLYARTVTQLVACTGPQRYQEFAWDGSDNAKFKIDAVTVTPMRIDSVLAQANGRTLLTHVFGGFSMAPALPPLSTVRQTGCVQSITLELTMKEHGVRLELESSTMIARPTVPAGGLAGVVGPVSKPITITMPAGAVTPSNTNTPPTANQIPRSTTPGALPGWYNGVPSTP